MLNIYKYKNIAIQKAKNGRGIFALKDFKKGAIVFEVTGVFISGYEDEDIDEKTCANAFRYDKNKYISPNGEIGDFLNHSCEPNAKVVKTKNKLFITAIDGMKKARKF